jgi:hypothetical protein
VSIKLNLKPYYAWAQFIADERSAQKEALVGKGRVFSKNYQIVGILGELAYSIVTGEPMDSKQRLLGDGGTDFSGGINIKSGEVGKTKYLIEDIDKLGHVDIYILVVVNLGKITGEIIGWIDYQGLREGSRVKDFGYGDRLALPIDELHDIMTFGPVYNTVLKRYNQYSKLLEL